MKMVTERIIPGGRGGDVRGNRKSLSAFTWENGRGEFYKFASATREEGERAAERTRYHPAM